MATIFTPFSSDYPKESAPGAFLKQLHIFRLDFCRGPSVDGGVGRDVKTLAYGGNGLSIICGPSNYHSDWF